MDIMNTMDTIETAPQLPRLGGRKRGFAALTVERRREIARQGGQTAHARGRAHEFTTEEAREAGRKGGRTISRDRQYMATIGRRGGLHSKKARQERLG
ncbi:MAG TPA: KGG domain-containing protein [Methylomirabilota bacterium]|jgi:general stress protein YciG|nr:KGG domain-containing protein [Methylomirabilota bacterium]